MFFFFSIEGPIHFWNANKPLLFSLLLLLCYSYYDTFHILNCGFEIK